LRCLVGATRGKGTFKNGQLDGPVVGYHDNGELSDEKTYKNVKLEGPWTDITPIKDPDSSLSQGLFTFD
jgi:hypothetical protein